MSFLSAEWRKLALANYEVDPSILKNFIPHKTEIDHYNGICYVSLVGFMFVKTRLLGIPVPFHRNFEEVNLRFYVRHQDNGEWKRGVVFIKEIVPKPAITWVANNVYSEQYETMKMAHIWKKTYNRRIVEYCWSKGGKFSKFLVSAELNAKPIEGGTETEFITEHYWGYTKVSNNKTYEYEVTHPTWESYKVLDHEISVDFEAVYGAEFSELTVQQPKSVMLAEGSSITVEKKVKI